MISLIILSLSNFVTFSQVGVDELYQKMGYPQETLALIKSQGIASKTLLTWGMLAWLVPMLSYLGWTKRFFGSKKETALMEPQRP